MTMMFLATCIFEACNLFMQLIVHKFADNIIELLNGLMAYMDYMNCNEHGNI